MGEILRAMYDNAAMSKRTAFYGDHLQFTMPASGTINLQGTTKTRQSSFFLMTSFGAMLSGPENGTASDYCFRLQPYPFSISLLDTNKVFYRSTIPGKAPALTLTASLAYGQVPLEEYIPVDPGETIGWAMTPFVNLSGGPFVGGTYNIDVLYMGIEYLMPGPSNG